MQITVTKQQSGHCTTVWSVQLTVAVCRCLFCWISVQHLTLLTSTYFCLYSNISSLHRTLLFHSFHPVSQSTIRPLYTQASKPPCSH